MRELLYSKYNNMRRKPFRTSIKIYSDGDIKYVVKSPLCDRATEHVKHIVSLYNEYKTYYKDISFLEPQLRDDSVIVPYISGKSVDDIIMNGATDEADIVKGIKRYSSIILDVNEKYVTEFSVTDKFTEFFGDIDGIEAINNCNKKGYLVANFDSCFDNYCESEGIIYAFDYEWILDVPVPADFVLYRAVKMFYIKHLVHTYRKTGRDDIRRFIAECGIPENEQSIYEQMDEMFQFYVHGKNREAIYKENYCKRNISIDMQNLADRYLASETQTSINRAIDEREEVINNQNQIINSLNEKINSDRLVIEDLSRSVRIYRKALRNPVYAMYRLCRKLAYKVLPKLVLRALQIIRNEGLYACYYRLKQRKAANNEYGRWITEKEKAERESGAHEKLEYTPLISVIMPVYNVSERLLTECIESVVKQSYDNWQLCMADDCSTMPEVKKVLKRYEDNPKIDIIYREENGHISRATNSALEVARGEFIALLDCDDLLTTDALYEVAKTLNNNRWLDYIYSDEDKIDENSKTRFMPHFKPDWSPDTLMSNMYTCHLSVYRKSIIDKLGGLRVGYEGSQDYDLCLRVTEMIPDSHIAHIPKILYHWRVIESSTAGDTAAKPYILEAAYKAKSDAVMRRGLKAKIELIDNIYQYRVNYLPIGNDKVSIIIPSKDNSEVLSRCLNSITTLTDYKNYEIIVVDNGSGEANKAEYEKLCAANSCRYIYKPQEFNFSRMCNIGVAASTGQYLLFLNDDMEILDAEWLERMLGQAQIDYAGAVGAKLLYPNSRLIQHTGVINILNGPTHALAGLSDDIIHYFGRNVLDYNYSAVTAACLMVDKKKFTKVGGFNENFAVAYNDVDLCFKLVEAGYYNVVRNDVILYHYESYSRGDDLIDESKLKRLESERDELYRIHPDFAPGDSMDRFYNRYLAQGRNDFSYNYEIDIVQPREYTVKKLSDFKESDKIKVHIDHISLGKRIKIDGWCYKINGLFKNLKTPKILVIDKDTVYQFDTNKVYRPDVSAIAEYKRLAMTGFTCESRNCFDKNKEYRVAVAIGNKYIFVNC